MSAEPPQVACNDCGTPLGRSWRPFLLCGDCRAKRAAEAANGPLRPRQAGAGDRAASPAPIPYNEFPPGF